MTKNYSITYIENECKHTCIPDFMGGGSRQMLTHTVLHHCSSFSWLRETSSNHFLKNRSVSD